MNPIISQITNLPKVLHKIKTNTYSEKVYNIEWKKYPPSMIEAV